MLPRALWGGGVSGAVSRMGSQPGGDLGGVWSRPRE